MIENKTAMIYTKVKPSERKRIEKLARENGMRLSEYVRYVLSKENKKQA